MDYNTLVILKHIKETHRKNFVQVAMHYYVLKNASRSSMFLFSVYKGAIIWVGLSDCKNKLIPWIICMWYTDMCKNYIVFWFS